MLFRRMKAFFFFKILRFFIILSNFSNFKFFSDFCQKNLKIKVERDFQEKIPFETHSRKNLPHAAILKNFKIFFRKKVSIFPKKNQILNVLRIRSIPVAFYGKFATIWRQTVFTFRREQKCRCWRERNWQTSGK